MNYSVPISQFRKDLFTYAKKVAEQGHELEVEKDGKAVFRVMPVEDDAKKRAKRALEIMKKLGGTWKDVKLDNEFFRGKKEMEYWKRTEK